MRFKSEENIEKIKAMPCAACRNNGGDAHHIRSQGAYGGDELENLLPLCRLCHTKVHQYGLSKFVYQYENVQKVIEDKGWHFDESMNRWVRRDLCH